MKKILSLLFFASFFYQTAFSQDQNPIIPSFGGVYDVDFVTEKPEPNLKYKVVIDIASGASDKSKPFYSLINVARLMNLHGVGGVKKENMNVVLAVHAGAIWSILNNEEYKEKYDTDNPHLPLLKELTDAGVKIFVCSQSMKARGLTMEDVAPNIEAATSMLTTMTTYQLKGYAALKF